MRTPGGPGRRSVAGNAAAGSLGQAEGRQRLASLRPMFDYRRTGPGATPDRSATETSYEPAPSEASQVTKTMRVSVPSDAWTLAGGKTATARNPKGPSTPKPALLFPTANPSGISRRHRRKRILASISSAASRAMHRPAITAGRSPFETATATYATTAATASVAAKLS
jgi:hypothetical protein